MAAGDVRILEGNPKQYKCAKFNGTSDYIKIIDNDKVSFGDGTTDSPFSISAWINMNDATAFEIASKGVYNTDGEYRFTVGTVDKITLQIYDESVADCIIGRSYNTVLTTYEHQWIHVVTTYDGSATSDGIKIYVNDVRVDDAYSQLNQANYIAMENLNANLKIGMSASGYANGFINNINIYNKALTQTEITTLYNGGDMRDNLVGEWKLQENFNDTSGNGLNGETVGATITTTDSNLSQAIKALPTGATDKNYFCHTEKGDMAVLNIEGA